MPDKEKIKHVLDFLANGRTCDYAPVQGGVLIIIDNRKQMWESVDIETFLELRNSKYIDMNPKETLHIWHPIFRPSFQNPINIYRITEKGRNYLKSEK